MLSYQICFSYGRDPVTAFCCCLFSPRRIFLLSSVCLTMNKSDQVLTRQKRLEHESNPGTLNPDSTELTTRTDHIRRLNLVAAFQARRRRLQHDRQLRGQRHQDVVAHPDGRRRWIRWRTICRNIRTDRSRHRRRIGGEETFHLSVLWNKR